MYFDPQHLFSPYAGLFYGFWAGVTLEGTREVSFMEQQIHEHDLIHGFRVERIRPVPDEQGTLYEMRHEKTNARLAWLAREDDNMTFSIGFRTVPWNDTGVFHICEHSVLNGSEKYPVKEPFVDLLQGSLQTFLNAMTAQDRTFYPISSRNRKDYLNLMDVYLDAVFHPAIYKNPNIFYQEGWHYEITDEKEPLKYNGVVFNEMKGAMSSPDELILDAVGRALYPDTCYAYNSGGDPMHIPDLSYTDFLAAHRRFYHPSNAYIFLDGRVDLAAALSEIDSVLAPFEAQEVSFPIPLQEPVAAKRVRLPYEVDGSQDYSRRTIVTGAGLLCTYDDLETLTGWNVLASVLTGSNEAPLKKAILSLGLAEDVDVSLLEDMKQPGLSWTVRNLKEADIDRVIEVVHATLKELAEKGLNHEDLAAELNQQEFRYRMKQEPAGVILADACYRSWMHGGDPMLYINCSEVYGKLRGRIEEGWFEGLAQKFLDEESHEQIVAAVPDPDLGARRQAEEEARLAAVKASWSTQQLQEAVAACRKLHAWQETPDSPQAKATLPSLKLSEISPDPLAIEGKEETAGDVPLLVYDRMTPGIAYFNLYFEIAGVQEKDLPAVSLWSSLLTRVRTADHSLLELQRAIKTYIGVLSFSTSAVSPKDRPEVCAPYLVVSCACLEKNLKIALDLVAEVLTSSVFGKETVQPLVQQELEGLRQQLIRAGHQEAVARTAGVYSAAIAAREYMSGLTYGQAVKELSENYEEQAEGFLENCRLYSRVFVTSDRLTASCSAGTEEDLRAWIGALPRAEFHRCVVHMPLLTEMKSAVIIPSQVSFSAMAMNVQDLSAENFGTLRVLAHALTYGYLWSQVRVRGGAYGTGATMLGSGLFSVYSGDDPTPMRTLAVDKEMFDHPETLDKEMTTYIIGTIAAMEPLMSDMTRMRTADVQWLSRIDYAQRQAWRQAVLAVTRPQTEQLMKQLAVRIRQGAEAVVGPESAAGQDRGFPQHRL
jgi:Zn-dependent M16 (insulinase) family peptidase